MADLFAQEGIAPPKDLFKSEGVEPPSLSDRNRQALSPMQVEDAPKEVQDEEAAHREEVMQLARARFSQDEIDAMKNKGEIGFLEAYDFLDYQDILPGGGFFVAADLVQLSNAADKMEAGEELSESENKLMDTFIRRYVEKEVRGMSVGGQINYYGSQVPAFAIEFAATAGAGKTAQESAEQAAKAIIKKAVARKVTAKAAGLTANVAARTAAMPAQYAPKYAELRLNDNMALTDKGAVIMQESKESPAKSALKAFAYTGIEVASEMSGAALGKYIVKPAGRAASKVASRAATTTAGQLAAEAGTKYLKTPIATGLQKLPAKLRINMYNAYKAIRPNAKVSDVFTRLGWNGMLEELGEERIADVMRATFDLSTDEEYTMQDYLDNITPSSEQLLVEAGIISIFGGMKASTEIAKNLIEQRNGGDKKAAQETVDNMSQTELEDLVESKLQVQPNREQTLQDVESRIRSHGVDLYLSERGDTIILPKIIVPEARRNKGHGTKALEDIIEHADRNGQKVALTPTGDFGGDKARLVDFYKRFGFVENKGSNRDHEISETMYREPVKPKPPVKSDEISQAQQLAAKELEPPQINNEESGFNRFYRDFVNSLQPIQDVTQMAQERGAEIEAGKNPFTLSRTYAGVIGQIQHNLQYGTTKLNPETGQFEVTGKSMKSIMDDFDNTVAHIETNRDTRETDFDDYLVARRTLEDLLPRDDVKVSEKDRVKSVETMNRLAEKYGEEFQWFAQYAEEMYDYQRRVLGNLVDSGVIAQKQFDEIVSKNPNYIPFQRVLEEEHFSGAVASRGAFTNASARKAIKKIQGSNKDIKNTAHSVIANTAKIIDIAYRNRVATGIADLADIMPEYIQKVKTPMKKVVVKDPETGKEIETYRPSEIQPKDTVVAYRDGKKQYYKVSEPLLDAMNNLSPVQMNATFRLLTEPLRVSARLLRAGATLVPEFWVRNVIRDQSTAFLQSPIRPTPIDMVQGLAAVAGKTDLYKDWMVNGGTFNSYMELDDKGLEKAYQELFKPQGKFARYTRNPINILADISMALEQGTRIGVFKKAKSLGIEGMDAALLAREATLDFGRGGVVSRNINQYIPFFNAGVQSVDKLARTFKENPKATALWGMATITLPSVLLTGYYLYGADEETRREYLEIPQWQKDMFWVFKEDGEWRRIPKPFSFGYLFGSVPERFMTWGYEGDKPEVREFWKELATGVAGTVSPVYDPSAILPPLVKIAIEDLTNYNFFTGRNIYPEWMNRLEPEQRKNKFTSQTSTELGKLLGVSPALLDNTLRGQLAGSAKYITDAGDTILNSVKEWNGETLPEKPVTDSDVPVIKAFSVREPTGYNTNTVANFFDDWQQVSQINATFNRLEGEEKIEYREQNENLLRAYKPMKTFYDRIRKVGKRSDRIYKDEAMSADEKVNALSENGKIILDTAIEANKWYKENVKGN
jgi:GNAT superfamily N-acetyltransferase